jgi:hypothetical protein
MPSLIELKQGSRGLMCGNLCNALYLPKKILPDKIFIGYGYFSGKRLVNFFPDKFDSAPSSLNPSKA